MLPKITELNIIQDSEETQSQSQGLSFLFDFSTGDFVTRDGKFVEVEGKEALKQWITMTIKTIRNRFEVYKGTNYGVRTDDLIGSVYPTDFIEKETQNEITNALLEHPAINSLTNWNFVREDSFLKVNFTVNSIYDPIPIEEVLS